MITTPAYVGAAFGTIGDGDLSQAGQRETAAGDLGISPEWAWMTQVHGGAVRRVNRPGVAGEADALVTEHVDLPLAVRTADCIPVVIHAESAVAVVHAGWRGLAAGVLTHALAELTDGGDRPVRAAIGPSIGPCCYEVGAEVIAAIGGSAATTTWGTASVDLWSAAERQLAGVEVWRADLCTHCEVSFHSYRASGTARRQTSVGWR